jgi:hypothetical protein
MGVFDDERTPRERAPARPVRCLEDDLAPALPQIPLCTTCGNHALKGKTVCLICEREQRVRPWSKSTTVQEMRKFMRLRAKMICHGGVLRESKTIAHVLADFVAEGNARWATRRDLHRLGLPDDGPRVAILLGWPK